MLERHNEGSVDVAWNPGGAIEGIIFDAVGTIMEPCPSVSEVYAEAAARQGVVIELDAMKQRFRASFRRAEAVAGGDPLVTDEATEGRRWRRIVAECLPEVSDPESAFEELWQHFGRPESWRAFADAAATLRRLARAGYAVLVASNFDSRLRGVLAGLDGLESWADRVVISSEIGYRKPSPRFFEVACDRLGLDPGRVLCVGDDVDNDWLGARASGLRAVLVDRQHRLAEGFDTVARLADLVEPLLSPRSASPAGT